MTITRIGTNQKYAEGWDAAFGGRKSGARSAQKKAPPPSKKATAKKSGRKGKR